MADMNGKPVAQSLTPILLIAVVQGWLLYGLHVSLTERAWPATDLKWLVPLYAIAVFVPLTLQMLAERLRQRPLWTIVAIIMLTAAALGAYTGWVVEPSKEESAGRFSSALAFYFIFFCAWFIALPFVQSWLRNRDRRFPYHDLFEFSWQNELLLLEATLFTGIFWGLLALWAALFKVVNISLFAELFQKPVFAYPVSVIVFGYAIYLIQARIGMVVTLRRHLHGVFSWLLPLVAAIAIMFLAVLPFTGLEPLWKTGRATLLMLWLQVLLILFLNAAYEDGGSEPGYPGWLKKALRAAVFGMPLYAALCAYSLGLRVEQYGWTEDRVWAALITFMAILYGLGYAAAALRGSPWMAGMARINVLAAWTLIGLLLLVSSPLLDPKRLSVNSQMSRLAAGKVAPSKFDYDYLRFDSGRHGAAALAELAGSTDPEVARLASAAIAKTNRWERKSPPPPEDIATRIELYPVGATLDPAFLDYLRESAKDSPANQCLTRAGTPCLMLAQDLNRDGRPEIVILGSWPQSVYSKIDGKWVNVGNLVGPHLGRQQAAALLKESRVQVERPQWSSLRIGEHRFTVQEQTQPARQKQPASK